MTERDSLLLRRELAIVLPEMVWACSARNLSDEDCNALRLAYLAVIGEEMRAPDVRPAYLYAMRTRHSTFPLSASEMLQAHRALANLKGTRNTGNANCAYCHNLGKVTVFDRTLEQDVEIECPGALHKKS